MRQGIWNKSALAEFHEYSSRRSDIHDWRFLPWGSLRRRGSPPVAKVEEWRDCPGLASSDWHSLRGKSCRSVRFLPGKHLSRKPIASMSLALESVCEVLGLRLTDDPATRVVAGKIIEYAQRGVRDTDTLRAMVLKEFDLDK
jgi:hypothetical protein